MLDDTQALWTELLPQMGVSYRDAVLVLFRDVTSSGCGSASAAISAGVRRFVPADDLTCRCVRARAGAPVADANACSTALSAARLHNVLRLSCEHKREAGTAGRCVRLLQP